MPQHSKPTNRDRRHFIRSCSTGLIGATAVTSLASGSPFVHTAKRQEAESRQTVIGEGDFVYSVDHQICQLPKKYKWQTGQGVCVDSQNNLYVFQQGRVNQKDLPAIYVFDQQGKFIRAFGGQFQGGGHGIEARVEDGEEFLYVTAHHDVKSFAKLTLTGEIVWYKKAPMESGVYAGNEHLSTKRNWTRKGFLPTNIAFLDNGGFVLADGYGSYYLHEFDPQGKWVRCFGGHGKGDGKFAMSHGLWQDDRPGRPEKHLYVTDRKRHQVQVLTRDGKHVKTIKGFGLPANVDTYQNLMLIPELEARLTILDQNDQVVARLGDGRQNLEKTKNLRGKPKEWIDGQFVHPHDACFDLQGDIYVGEWVGAGRITKLTRKS